MQNQLKRYYRREWMSARLLLAHTEMATPYHLRFSGEADKGRAHAKVKGAAKRKAH
jgi:hypothetical protein